MNQIHDEKIFVVGAGAIGSLFGGLLSRSGYNVTLIDGWLEHVRRIDQEGLEISTPDGNSKIKVKALNAESLMGLRTKPDIVLLAVKSYDTRDAMDIIRPLLRDQTLIVSCQNGVNEELIASIAGPDVTLGCVISFGAELLGPGHVKQLRNKGRLIIGHYGGDISRATSLKNIFSSITHTQVTGNLIGHRWAKLAINCIGNPLQSLSGLTAQELCQYPGARKVMINLVEELVRTGEASGIVIEPILGLDPGLWKQARQTRISEVENALDRMGRNLGESRSSMVYDLNSGRQTEIDFLNGYVVRKAAEKGLAAPCNKAIVDLVKKLSRGEIEAGPDILDLLINNPLFGLKNISKEI